MQTSVNVQASEFAARYVDPEGVPIANAGQALLGAGSASASSSNAPKFGTLIPNRIFVGGIPSNASTTEQELKTYFSSFGQVKDVKIINDRLGVSKGSYGFVTFESQEVAEKIIKNESETLIFKDRKLNIGHAIRKQQLFPRPADVPPALFFPGGAAIPCSFQSGMPIFPLTGQDYSVLAQPGSTYQQMLLQQANGAMYLSPQPNQQAAAAAAATAAAVQYSALQSHLAAHQNAAAATFATLQHHQQYQQASLTAPLAAGGQTSQAAMMAAAAAAVAAASQWSNAANTAANGHNSSGTTSAGLPPPPQLTPAPSVSVGQHAPATLGGAVSGNCNGVLDVTQSPQVAALAAAVAAQQQLAAAAAAAAAWRWSSPSAAAAAAAASQHSSGGSGALLAPSPSALTNGSATTPTGQSVSQTASQQIHSHDLPLPPQQPHHQQQQLAFLPNTTTTSDYSTDHSAHSSGLMESVEPSIFHCDGLMSPPQQLQPTLLPTAVFAPAIFEGGIAATSSPLLTTHRHLVSPSANNNHNNTNTTITVTPTATSTNGNGSCTSNCAGQTSSQQAPQTPHLYGTPTPQPIILDVYSGAGGGIPLAPLKQTSLLSAEGLMVVEHTGGASGLKQNGGGGGGCGAGGRGGAGSSPKKLTAANGTTTNTRAAI
uniref:Protein boule n=1 Tax=Echinococcus granulosus TaxID=6210 RepID=A0A068WY18_ECHGR|nr:protein boule [Echinococcus granulosus]